MTEQRTTSPAPDGQPGSSAWVVRIGDNLPAEIRGRELPREYELTLHMPYSQDEIGKVRGVAQLTVPFEKHDGELGFIRLSSSSDHPDVKVITHIAACPQILRADHAYYQVTGIRNALFERLMILAEEEGWTIKAARYLDEATAKWLRDTGNLDKLSGHKA